MKAFRLILFILSITYASNISAQVVEVMTSKNYIKDKETITSEGEKIGIKFKQNAKGTKWIVYPEYLAEIL